MLSVVTRKDVGAKPTLAANLFPVCNMKDVFIL